MANEFEKRRENRLNYNWPVWFAEDYNNILSQGQMIDISSEGAAFTCYADKCPHTGEEITARFSVPSHHNENDFDLENFIRKGHVCRIEEIGGYIRKVAIQFAEPLPFKPGEVEKIETQTETFEAYEAAKSAPAGLNQSATIARDEAIAAAKEANKTIKKEKSLS